MCHPSIGTSQDEASADLDVVMLAIEDAREEALRRQLRHEAQAAEGR
jgi:hypothetical protein